MVAVNLKCKEEDFSKLLIQLIKNMKGRSDWMESGTMIDPDGQKWSWKLRRIKA